MKHNLGIVDMNKKIALFACVLGSFGLSGCTTDSPYNEGPYVSQQVNAPSPCDSNYLDAACQSQFVNYTDVAADYRQYGERTPQDIMVSQAAAGNNMTASIPARRNTETFEGAFTFCVLLSPVSGFTAVISISPSVRYRL